MPEAPLEVTYTMRRAEWVAASLAMSAGRVTLVGVALGVPGMALAWWSRARGAWWGLLALALASGLWWTFVAARTWVTTLRRPEAFPAIPQRIRIEPAGVSYESGRQRTHLGWPFVRAVTRRGPWVVMWVDARRGVPIPRRAFASRDAERAFVAAARTWRAEPAPPAPPAPAPGAPPLADATFRLDAEDFVALRRFSIREQTRRGWGVGLVAGGLMVLAMAAALWSLARGSDLGEAAALLLLAGVAALVTAIPLLRIATARRATLRVMRREPHRYTTAPRRVQVWPDRVELTTEVSQTVLPWSNVRRVVRDGPRVYLFVDAAVAFVLRADAFADPDVPERLDLWRAGSAPGVARGDPSRALADPFAPPAE